VVAINKTVEKDILDWNAHIKIFDLFHKIFSVVDDMCGAVLLAKVHCFRPRRSSNNYG
jgi:hypothetical protein